MVRTAAVLDISDFMQFSEHGKSSSIQEIYENYSKYFKGTITFVVNVLLLIGAFPIIFTLYSKDLHYLFHSYNNSTSFLMSQNNCQYILSGYTLA